MFSYTVPLPKPVETKPKPDAINTELAKVVKDPSRIPGDLLSVALAPSQALSTGLAAVGNALGNSGIFNSRDSNALKVAADENKKAWADIQGTLQSKPIAAGEIIGGAVLTATGVAAPAGLGLIGKGVGEIVAKVTTDVQSQLPDTAASIGIRLYDDKGNPVPTSAEKAAAAKTSQPVPTVNATQMDWTRAFIH